MRRQEHVFSNKHLSIVPTNELKDKYLKEKRALDGDPEALESWLENLRTLVATSKVNNDIQLTKGLKLAKFMV